MVGAQLLKLPALRRRFENRFVNRGTQPGSVLIDSRHTYILPTRHGVLFSGVLLAMLIGSINYSNSMGFMLTFLLGSLATASILHTYRNLKGIVIRPGRVAPVFAGERADFIFHLDNPTPTPRYRLELQIGSEHTIVEEIGGHTHATAHLSVTSRERGLLHPGRIKIETTFPLGLFRAWSWIESDSRCLVYPTPELNPPPPPLAAGSDAGGRIECEGMDDFAGLRGYHTGDSLRHVAWKVVARGQPLMTKQFTAEEGATAWLDWSTLLALSIEARLSRLCGWVLELEQERIDYGMTLPEQTISGGSGEQQRQQALKALALFGKGGEDAT